MTKIPSFESICPSVDEISETLNEVRAARIALVVENTMTLMGISEKSPYITFHDVRMVAQEAVRLAMASDPSEVPIQIPEIPLNIIVQESNSFMQGNLC